MARARTIGTLQGTPPANPPFAPRRAARDAAYLPDAAIPPDIANALIPPALRPASDAMDAAV